MGKHGEVPSKRRIWYKTGMSSTTLDLSEGTTKATYQVGEACSMVVTTHHRIGDDAFKGIITRNAFHTREGGDLSVCIVQRNSLFRFTCYDASVCAVGNDPVDLFTSDGVP